MVGRDLRAHPDAKGLCLAGGEGGMTMISFVINSQLGWGWGLGPHVFPTQELSVFPSVCLPALHPHARSCNQSSSQSCPS